METVMKTDYVTQKFISHWLFYPLFAAQLMLPVDAAVVDIAKAPLYTTTTSSVKPNLMFILDNSASMSYDFLPDEASGSSTFGYKSSQCNGVAYNPAITYTLPVDSTGTVFGAPSFTSAWVNGFNPSGGGSIDLTGGIYYNYIGSQTPLSYTYDTNGVISTTFYNECKIKATTSPTATIKVGGSSTTVVSGITVNGVQILSGVTSSSSSTSTVASNIASKITLAGYSATASGSTVTITGPSASASFTPVITIGSGTMTFTPTAFSPFVQVTVSNTSGPGASDERQNYANWYSFYHTRLLTMKTAVTQAFKNITSSYRVGYSTISNQGGTDATNFLHISDFDSTQKSSFYTKLTTASGGGTTPLRGALSKIGRIYAGKLGNDPMQYSCQQNFTILSTDGYWNIGAESTAGTASNNYGPYQIDNITPVGQQDGSAPKPMWDGAASTVTKTTPTVTITTVTTPKTVVDRSTRIVTSSSTDSKNRTDTYTRTTVTWAKGSCSGSQKQSTTKTYTGTTTETLASGTTSAQTQEQTTTTGSNDVSATTSTVTHTMVTTNGVVTSDTMSNPVTSTSSSSTTTSGPTVSAWTNVGSPTAGTIAPSTTYSPVLTSISWGSANSTTVSATCVSNATANTDNAATPVLTSSGSWSSTTTTPNSPTTSATTHDGTYPTTTTQTATTVVNGPTVGTTTTTTVNAAGNANSLADIAMYYYQTDLRNPGNCTSALTGANLCPTDSNGNYSPNVPGNGDDNNPKPHMTTFTLGLGVSGLLKYSPTYANDTSGDFYDVRVGSKVWPDPDSNTTSPDYAGSGNSVVERIDDLWHAAVNGRGTYFSAQNPTALVTSLNSALVGIQARLGYGTSAATSNLAPIQGDNFLYVASYTTAQWIGNLVAESINVDTGAVNETTTWCVEDVKDANANVICTGKLASQVHATSDDRTIYFNKSGTLTNITYSGLSTAQKAYFDNTKLSQYSSTFSTSDKTIATGDTLVQYLRGQTQYETGKAGSTANLYRLRKATLGDTVDSPSVFLGKPIFDFTDPGYNGWKNSTAQQSRGSTVFTGANDGMLHAFNATTGIERWAYIPTLVMPNMYWLADINYATNHHNYVNGKIVYSDVCVKDCSDASKADWRTILMGGLNGGGRGYYALDVTDPTSPKFLWEFTSLNDKDLGYSFGNPLAVKKSDGTWVVLVSSGYDNVALGNGDPYDTDGDGKGYLFVLNPLTGTVINKIPTTVGSKTTPSGLGRISYWADDPEKDATALYAYGGDLLGNLWRFDINTQAVVKLAALVDSSGNAQPITTRPELTKINGNRVVYVSTGKYLEASDLDSTTFKTQSVYGIVDSGIVVTRATLQSQTLTNAKPNRTVTANVVTISPPTHNGWYVDFPDSGERSNVDMLLAQGTLLVPTNVPTNGICEAGGYSWLNFLNYKTGSYVPGATSAGTWSGNDLTTGINLVWIKGQPVVIRTGSGTAPKLLTGVPFNSGGASGVTGHRVSWRDISTK
jgi:type IV pilus assembly protein PilY1